MTPISKFFIFLFILTLAIVAVEPIVKRLRSTLTRLAFCIRIMKRLNHSHDLKRAGGNKQTKRLDKNENACYNDSSKII